MWNFLSGNWYYLLSLFISALGLIGLVLVYKQIKQAKKSFIQAQKAKKDQYDLARREKTVEIVIYYTQKLTKETRRAEQLVSTLSKQQCKALYELRPFKINAKAKKSFCEICPHYEKCKEASKILKSKQLCKQKSKETFTVDGDLLFDLRWNVMRYLNTLESVFLAWQIGIIDESIIDNQFQYLKTKEPILENFRNIAGNGHSFPAIEDYYWHLNKQKEKEREERMNKRKKSPIDE